MDQTLPPETKRSAQDGQQNGAVRLLVVGISVLDYVHRMDKLPVGGKKFRSTSFERIGGGCGANAAVGAARLGAEVTFVTRLGADAAGDELAAMLETQGLHLVAPRRGRQMLSSIMIDAAGERMIINYPGDDLHKQVPDLPSFDAVLTDCRWPEASDVALRAARDAGVPGVIDGERYVPPELAALASHVVFSAPGLRDYSRVLDLDEALAKTAADLPGSVGFTDGPRGVVWAEGAEVPAPQIEAVDTLGAGDLWHGAFAMAIGAGQTLEAASRFANQAAALKCTRAGGWDVYPRAEEIS
jgi:sulfofructose kinase